VARLFLPRALCAPGHGAEGPWRDCSRTSKHLNVLPEDSSAGRQRLAHISKQGNRLLRFLLGEAAQAAVRRDPDWRRRYLYLAMRRDPRIAKVAMARKLAVRLYWMWRNGWDYAQAVEFASHAGQLEETHGVK